MIHVDFTDLKLSNSVKVLDEAAIRQTGNTSGGFTFAKGDVIEFAPSVIAFNDPFKRKDGLELDCIKTVVGLNGVVKHMPLSVLIRVPFQQLEEWLQLHDVNREIYNAGDNFERLTLLKGKVLVVTDVIKGPKATFDDNNSIKKDADGNYVTKDGLFPVFGYYTE